MNKYSRRRRFVKVTARLNFIWIWPETCHDEFQFVLYNIASEIFGKKDCGDMNKWTKILLTMLLTLCVSVPALAEATVYATANVNLRTGPGLGYEKVASVPSGTGLEFLGRVSADDREIDWYQVRYYGDSLWISSRYADLDPEVVAASRAAQEQAAEAEAASAIPLATPQAVITQVPSFDDEATLAPTFGVPGMIELSPYYHTRLKDSALALGLTNYKQDQTDELQNMYYNDVLLIAGNDDTEHFRVTGTGYTIFGVYVGMDISAAQAVLTAAGLVQSAGTMGLYFQHPADGDGVDPDGFDSGISAVTDGSGAVTEISWSTYTG